MSNWPWYSTLWCCAHRGTPCCHSFPSRIWHKAESLGFTGTALLICTATSIKTTRKCMHFAFYNNKCIDISQHSTPPFVRQRFALMVSNNEAVVCKESFLRRHAVFLSSQVARTCWAYFPFVVSDSAWHLKANRVTRGRDRWLRNMNDEEHDESAEHLSFL